MAGDEIEELVKYLARLPGLGPRSARRAVLTLMRRREALLVVCSLGMGCSIRCTCALELRGVDGRVVVGRAGARRINAPPTSKVQFENA